MIHSDILEVSTEKELIDVCVHNRWDRKEDAFISHASVCFEYFEHVGAVKFEKWYKMSKQIQRRNVWVCTVAQLSEVTGIAVGNRLNILLRKFASIGLCVVEYPEGKYDGKSSVSERRRVVFNPHLVWKGCHGKQYQYKKEWDISRYGYSLK